METNNVSAWLRAREASPLGAKRPRRAERVTCQKCAQSTSKISAQSTGRTSAQSTNTNLHITQSKNQQVHKQNNRTVHRKNNRTVHRQNNCTVHRQNNRTVHRQNNSHPHNSNLLHARILDCFYPHQIDVAELVNRLGEESKHLDEYVNSQSVIPPHGNCWGRNKTFAGTSSTTTRKKILGWIR